MEHQEKEFIKGFNNGYTLAQYEPEIADMMVKSQNENSEYFKGLVFGKEQFGKDKQIVKDAIQPGPDKDKEDRERDI